MEAKKLPIIPLCLILLLVGAAAWYFLCGLNARALVEEGIAAIRDAGPWVFFGALAVLPAIGAPLLAFTITCGDAFAPQMTLGGVILAALAAIAFNLALTYWLARYALRPLLSRLVARYGYRVPRATAESALSIALVIRLTPGPPFFLQSYLLGLAEVPFRLYMIVSWLCVLPWAMGAIVVGRGVLNGNFKLAGTGVGVLVAAVAIVHWLRRKYAARVD